MSPNRKKPTCHEEGRKNAMPYIKRIANLTITYDTPPEKIDRAIDMVKEILNGHEGMNPDFPPWVYFNEFNADSLNISVTYWYHPPDYWAFMEFSERFNKEVFRRFNEEAIEFGFSTTAGNDAGEPGLDRLPQADNLFPFPKFTPHLLHMPQRCNLSFKIRGPYLQPLRNDSWLHTPCFF
jgi:Mechanosensitive ion channel MscS, C-terminal